MKIKDKYALLAGEQGLPWFCAMVGAVIAVWMNYQARGVINHDGVLYLEVARLFSEGQWREGFAVYDWPFYSLLISLAHKATGLQLQTSANLLAVLFFAATCMGMAVLIREIGGSRQTVITGLILLIASPYLAGDILPMVVRDHGYWTFFLWSLVFFLRFLRDDAWKNAIFWGVLAIVCVLFRIEGLTYLVALPLVLLAGAPDPVSTRWRRLLKANTVLIASGLGLVMLLAVHPTLHLSDLGRLSDPLLVAERVFRQLTSGLSSRAEVMAEQVLGSYLDDYAMAVLLLGLLYILLYKAFTVGGILQSALALVFWKKTRNVLTARHFEVLAWLLILGLINAAMILLKGFVLPGRMLAPIGLVVITFAAFGVSSFIDNTRKSAAPKSHWGKWLALLMAIVLLIQLASVLRPSSPQERYERDAVEWVLSKTHPNSRIYFQTERLRFYAGEPMRRKQGRAGVLESRWQKTLKVRNKKNKTKEELERISKTQEMDAYDYFLFLSNKKDPWLEDFLATRLGTPLAIFHGPRGNRALVYRNANPG